MIASMWQNFRVVLPLFCGMTPQIFCHELPHNGGDCHLSLNRSKLLSPFVFPLFLTVDRTKWAVVAAMIMGSLRCLGDLGASVSKIFRPDRQNGFISAAVAKSILTSCRGAKRRSIQPTSRQARTLSFFNEQHLQ